MTAQIVTFGCVGRTPCFAPVRLEGAAPGSLLIVRLSRAAGGPLSGTLAA